VRPEKVKQAKSKVKSILIVFFNIKGLVHKEFFLSFLHTTVMFYIKSVKMCEDFAIKKLAVASQRHTLTFPFSPGSF
jgi:hypothetical protein